jgi:hypothetical protein
VAGGLIVSLVVRLLGDGDGAVLERVARAVFDGPIDPRWSAEFLADPRHHLAAALDADVVVGMAFAVRYVHPDKAPQLWINEVAAAPMCHRRGLGRPTDRGAARARPHARLHGGVGAHRRPRERRSARALRADRRASVARGSVTMYTHDLLPPEH